MYLSRVSLRTTQLPIHDRRSDAWLENAGQRLVANFLPSSSRWFRRTSFVRSAGFFAPSPVASPASVAVSAGTASRSLNLSTVSELGILLALSVMFPFLIHILPVPEDARLGPRLLPMFYAPLLAALLGRTRSALIVAVAAPWLNWALTTHPAPRGAIVAMLQLLVFVWVVRLLLGRLGGRWYLAAPAYVACWAIAMIVAALFPSLIDGRPVVAWAMNSVTMALPGLAILLLINGLVVRYASPGSGGGGPIAA